MHQENPEHFFSKEDEKKVVAAIKAAENLTSGEIRVHLEAHTDEPNLEHAKKIFLEAGMTNTDLRNGVLFYLAVQDHQFSVVGDKGINEKVPKGFWDDIRNQMLSFFKVGDFVEGLIEGITMAGKALKEYFPKQNDDKNELPDQISKS
jgi:uncharacterized membrane protein